MKEYSILSVNFFTISSSKYMNPMAQFHRILSKDTCDVIYETQPSNIGKWRKSRALTVVIFLKGERKVTNEN